ncbi:MAG: cation:proton antiporter [Nitrospira sp.]|nr:cation:proton antiporter [Nitrospira sp.]
MAGVLAQSLARHLNIPSTVLLLPLGAALGPEWLNWVHPGSMGHGLFDLVDFAIAVILFEGGLNLQWSRLRRQEAPIRQLVTWGAVLTLAGATFAAHMILDWSFGHSLLFGSLVVVTGPTVVAPLVRNMRLRPHMRTIIEAEGVLIDPIGAVLAILVLNFVLSPAAETLTSELHLLAMRLGFGIVAGTVGGFLIGGLLRWPGLVPHGYTNIFTLALTYGLFQLSDQVIPQSGILAVTVAGILVGNLGTQVDRDLRDFKDQMTVMLVGLLFILLVADIRWKDIVELGAAAWWTVAVLIFMVRPASVFLSTIGTGLPIQERMFLAWVAPRGIVAAAIASLTAEAMRQEQLEGGEALRAMVFMTIGVTVLHASIFARPMAHLLQLRLPKRETVAILGVRELSLAVAAELKKGGTPVVFIDSEPRHCRLAEDAGFPVIFGDALEERTMMRARFDSVETVVGLTENDHLNSRFVTLARTLFKVPHAYMAVDSLDGQSSPTHVRQADADILFEGPHDIERWNVRFRQRAVEMLEVIFTEPPKPSTAADDKPVEPKRVASPFNELCIFLAIHNGNRTALMRMGYVPKKGDRASVAVHRYDSENAREQLRQQGWTPLPREEPQPTPATSRIAQVEK